MISLVKLYEELLSYFHLPEILYWGKKILVLRVSKSVGQFIERYLTSG